MTVTTAQLISDTERNLLAGDRDEANLLTNSVNTTDTSFTFTYDLNGIQPGSYLALDLEICYVWAVNESANTATVQRAMLNSTAASHTAATMTYVNPKFSKWDILNALNVELADISPELFQVKSFSLTSEPVKWTYTVPAINTDILEILEIRYQPPDPSFSWPRVSRRKTQLLRSMPTTGDGSFTSAMGIRIEEMLYPGRPMTVRYAAPFASLTTLTDNVLTVTGLSASMLDIPPMGAAARLMGVREAKRAFIESTMDTRRASEVPTGASARAAQVLLSLVEGRIRSEVQALRQAWPESN